MVGGFWKKIKKEKTEKIKEKIETQIEEIETQMQEVESGIIGIIDKVNDIVKNINEKINSCEQNIKKLEESLYDGCRKILGFYIERIKGLVEEDLKKQVGNYVYYRAQMDYIKQITKLKELKERLGNLEREIENYKRIVENYERIVENYERIVENLDKIVVIIGKYLKTSSNYDENAQKIIEALEYNKEDLIDVYKVGIEVGYSREQLKNIAAAIALKESMRQRDEVIKSIGENPKEIRIYIAETAVKAGEELKERLYKEIYK